MVIANYRSDWESLSKNHEKIKEKVSGIIRDYADAKEIHKSYGIIGTFGSGKTQLLYFIHKISQLKSLIPIYVLAEDLFRDEIDPPDGKNITPAQLSFNVNVKLSNIKTTISIGDEREIDKLINSYWNFAPDLRQTYRSLFKKFKGIQPDEMKIVLLVDELEGQYINIQNNTSTSDKSPLREMLDDTSYLKFLAFAPAGIYELGDADRSRLKRIVIPSAEIDYVREKLINDAGHSNAAWWLSRGKARQLFKTIEILKENPEPLDSSGTSSLIRSNLDSIGQRPTEVPPAVLEKIPPSKIPFVLNILPMESDTKKRYVIEADNLNTGNIAEILTDAFNINRNNAVLIADYFTRTCKTLSNAEWKLWVDDKDLPDLLLLSLDHLLEYEHGSPDIARNLGEILNLYDRINKESASLYAGFSRLWEFKETVLSLPFTLGEIRNVFPFPSMNPIIKGYLPNKVKERWQNKGLPIWKWEGGGIDILFFADNVDMQDYFEKDEFISIVLPDGRSALCLIGSEEPLEKQKPMVKWLIDNGKMAFLAVPRLLYDFLLSLAGSLDNIPGDYTTNIQTLKDDREDLLLSRKAEIYGQAVEEAILTKSRRPNRFFEKDLPDSNTIWGTGQMDRNLSVTAISLAFTDLTGEEKEVLGKIRDLFKSGREGKGTGDLNSLMPRTGLIGFATDLLPRIRNGDLRDSDPVIRLREYWKDLERTSLESISRVLPLSHFLKISTNENSSRVLEALWRSVRKEFDSAVLNKYLS